MKRVERTVIDYAEAFPRKYFSTLRALPNPAQERSATT